MLLYERVHIIIIIIKNILVKLINKKVLMKIKYENKILDINKRKVKNKHKYFFK